MNKNKILSGGGKNLIGGGKWGRRGREVGGKGEGTGNGVPPVHPLLQSMQLYAYDEDFMCCWP